MGLLKRNPFGHILFIKKWLIRIFAVLTHKRYRGFNELQIEGSEIIKSLPDTNVLFISNHQTYFADVVAMFHVFNASLSGRQDTIKNLGYIWQPKMNIYYVAAKETMQAGLLPRILSYVGAITVERTWRCKGKDVTEKREVNPNDTENIRIALQDGWVITFHREPQSRLNLFVKVQLTLLNNTDLLLYLLLLMVFVGHLTKKGFASRRKESCNRSLSKSLYKLIMIPIPLTKSLRKFNLQSSNIPLC
jgi:hypothetical protein